MDLKRRAGTARKAKQYVIEREIPSAAPTGPFVNRRSRRSRSRSDSPSTNGMVYQSSPGAAGVEHGQDVRVLEPGGEVDLALEPFGRGPGGELGQEDLEGDRTVVPEVAREVDHAHAATAELALDRVALGQRLANLVRHVHATAPGRELRWRTATLSKRAARGHASSAGAVRRRFVAAGPAGKLQCGRRRKFAVGTPRGQCRGRARSRHPDHERTRVLALLVLLQTTASGPPPTPGDSGVPAGLVANAGGQGLAVDGKGSPTAAIPRMESRRGPRGRHARRAGLAAGDPAHRLLAVPAGGRPRPRRRQTEVLVWYAPDAI